jgi:single-stranded-DNA-specific exonuclease
MLEQAGLHPLLARLYAGRGVTQASEVQHKIDDLLPPAGLLHIDLAARLLADGIARGERFCIVADYDCDGATACAVGLRGLRMMGAQVDFFVPNRFETGYGLSPDVVRLVAAHPRMGKPDWIITVDNGIASNEGVALASEMGIRTLITDHHLPGDTLPLADCIVNPNQPGCSFASKHLAGVGVMFYVLLALRAELRTRGRVDEATQPKLAQLLDLVALGTVADVVRLDANNRILVAQGLNRMRKGQLHAGVAALFEVAGRDFRVANTFDLGFAVGPRINAAGRLADMELGIRCLLCDDPTDAQALAQQLDAINRDRRQIEAGMQTDALDALAAGLSLDDAAIVLHDATWHQGVIGIVAGRIKEKFWRPTIAFAPAGEDHPDELRGSGRSIPGLHLRDALDLVSKRAPGLIHKFGGHAMAAGLTISATDLPRFEQAFRQVCDEWLAPDARRRAVDTDGALDPGQMQPALVQMLETAVWGQGFAAPLFSDVFEVRSQRILKERHLKLVLGRGPATLQAIWFNHAEELPAKVRLAYRLATDAWQGVERVQLMVEHGQGV